MTTNETHIAHWGGRAGRAWTDHQEQMDQQLAPHAEVTLAAANPIAGEHVLDVGCGCGATSLALAESVGSAGSVTGVDISAPMVARARERASSAGLAHANFEVADAQTYRHPSQVDLAFSRFGVMFFDDTQAAFARIRGNLKPKGRFVFVCWQARELNQWITLPAQAAAKHIPLPDPPAPDAPGMFSLADRDRTHGLLRSAGFSQVDISASSVPVRIGGGSIDDAVSLFLAIGPVPSAMEAAGADPSLLDVIGRDLATLYRTHQGPNGIEFPSNTWLITATN